VSGEPKVALVVAMARANRIIGKDGGLPWHIPGDMKFFVSATKGKPCVMGRKTFESLGKPLPGRANLVVTRHRKWHADGTEVFHSVEAALARAREIAVRDGASEVCVIGGEGVYAQALPTADVIYLTEVAGDVDGDTYFPEVKLDDWEEVSRTPIPDDPRATHKAELVILHRR